MIKIFLWYLLKKTKKIIFMTLDKYHKLYYQYIYDIYEMPKRTSPSIIVL